MDAYHAPYKKQTRYWTGLTLLLRCALFLTFALTSQGNNNELKMDLVVITSVSAGLATLAWIHRGIYEKISLDILESFFVLNLCVFAVATYHMNKYRQHQTGISYAFVGLSFATFICIILHHIYLSVSKTALWQKLLHILNTRVHEKLVNACKKFDHEGNRQRGGTLLTTNDQAKDLNSKAPTTSTVELCEPLLLESDTNTQTYQ